jgi:hypothetical protein
VARCQAQALPQWRQSKQASRAVKSSTVIFLRKDAMKSRTTGDGFGRGPVSMITFEERNYSVGFWAGS